MWADVGRCEQMCANALAVARGKHSSLLWPSRWLLPSAVRLPTGSVLPCRGAVGEALKGDAVSCSRGVACPGTDDPHPQLHGFPNVASSGGAIGGCAGLWHCLLSPRRLLGQMPCAFRALRQSLYESSALCRSRVRQAPEVGWLLRVMAGVRSPKSTARCVTCVCVSPQTSQ